MAGGWSSIFLPKALPCHHSVYCREACSKLEPGMENKIVLPNCEPNTFKFFLQWMYEPILPEHYDFEVQDDVWDGLRAWVLGDRLQASGFKDSVMERIYNEHSMMTDDYFELLPGDLDLCDWKAKPGSSLRNFVMDTMSQQWVFGKKFQLIKEQWIDHLDEIPKIRGGIFCAMAGIGSNGDGLPEIKPLATYLEGPEVEF